MTLRLVPRWPKRRIWKPPPAARTTIPRIVLADPDPYLAFLIRLDLPVARVVEPGPGAHLSELLDEEPDLVIVDLSSSQASEVLRRRNGSKVVGIVEAGLASRTSVPAELDGLLLRPFVPAELHRAVRRALGLHETAEIPAGRLIDRIQAWILIAWLAVVAMATALELFGPPSLYPLRVGVLAASWVFAVSRLLVTRRTVAGAWAGVTFATVAIALTGGPSSNYLGLGVVACVEAGLYSGIKPGALAGLVIVGGSTYQFISEVRHGSVKGAQLVAWVVLFPLVSFTAGLAARIWPGETTGGTRRLAEANKVLSTLYRIARAMPGGLEIGSVASAALEEMRDTLQAPAGAVLIGEAGILSEAGSFGLAQRGGLILRRDEPTVRGLLEGGVQTVLSDALPAAAASALSGFDCWLMAPLRHGGVNLGLLMAACADHHAHTSNRIFLQELAGETAVAVENARLFGRVRELSVDGERRRLARELHDGVAQALTHVRFELELLSRFGSETPEAIQGEAARLARVVNRSLGEVRSAILGLRASVSGEGLAGSLARYLRDLRGLGGPEIEFKVGGIAVHTLPETEAEVFRIAQEAVSNALRHARASRVTVALEAAGSALRLMVEDDGIGVVPNAADSGGIGLAAMRERAHAIGGRLTVEGKPGRGTRVELVVEGAHLGESVAGEG